MIDNPWFALAAWLLSYLADYYLTLYSARIYRQGAKDHFTFEGSLELTPYYQADIDKLRPVSLRFILAVIMRHARNIALFRAARGGQGLDGQVHYARWLALRLSAVDLFTFAALSSPAVGSWPAALSPAR